MVHDDEEQTQRCHLRNNQCSRGANESATRWGGGGGGWLDRYGENAVNCVLVKNARDRDWWKEDTPFLACHIHTRTQTRSTAEALTDEDQVFVGAQPD